MDEGSPVWAGDESASGPGWACNFRSSLGWVSGDQDPASCTHLSAVLSPADPQRTLLRSSVSTPRGSFLPLACTPPRTGRSHLADSFHPPSVVSACSGQLPQGRRQDLIVVWEGHRSQHLPLPAAFAPVCPVLGPPPHLPSLCQATSVLSHRPVPGSPVPSPRPCLSLSPIPALPPHHGRAPGCLWARAAGHQHLPGAPPTALLPAEDFLWVFPPEARQSRP